MSLLVTCHVCPSDLLLSMGILQEKNTGVDCHAQGISPGTPGCILHALVSALAGRFFTHHAVWKSKTGVGLQLQPQEAHRDSIQISLLQPLSISDLGLFYQSFLYSPVTPDMTPARFASLGLPDWAISMPQRCHPSLSITNSSS